MEEKQGKQILQTLQKNGKKGCTFAELLAGVKMEKQALNTALRELKKQGRVTEQKRKFFLPESLGLVAATISGLRKTYGFARRLDNEAEVFVLGSRMRGAMIGDTVLLRISRHTRGDLDEGEVVTVADPSGAVFSGLVQLTPNGAFVLPDSLGKIPLRLRGNLRGLRDGDKVTASIVSRGESHREHQAQVVASFGELTAAACCRAVLAVHDITPEFSESVLQQAQDFVQKEISAREREKRLDLRDQCIFTIDGADTKDIDDAVSLEKTENGYLLGVHIADVSHYVKPDTPLDQEAFRRGTSIYYADQVIPMLPKALSNGICSLNPGEERLAFSALIELSADGMPTNYKFCKSLIRSRLKGVYTEVNALLDGSASDEIREKYREVEKPLLEMDALTDILIANRKQRGAPEIDSSESKFVIDGNGRVTDILPRTRGKAEILIEEFMLLANEAAADLAKKAELPFVYRVHETPNPEKIADLRALLHALEIPAKELKDNPSAGQLAAILEGVKDSPAATVVAHQVLRSMAKAKYSEVPIGHYGLVLENYAHFTSPIRRYPDLSIHRILSDYVSGRCKKETIQKKYRAFVKRASAQSSQTELVAVQVERSCEDCYKAEYMHSRIGQEFDGLITSATNFGFYVELPNTVEGLVRNDLLMDGDYQFDGMMQYRDAASGKRYRVGDPVKVRCIGADINAGNVDFVPADQPVKSAAPRPVEKSKKVEERARKEKRTRKPRARSKRRKH